MSSIEKKRLFEKMPAESFSSDERIVGGALTAARTITLESEPPFIGLPEEEKIRRIKEWRPIMFGRRENGEAFHELNDFELAFIEGEIKKYVQEKKLRVLEQTPDLSRLGFGRRRGGKRFFVFLSPRSEKKRRNFKNGN